MQASFNRYQPQKSTDLQATFNWDHFKMLFDSNPKAAEDYRLQFVPVEVKEKKEDRDNMVAFCKKHGVKVFPNYKDETVEKMYNELKVSLESKELSPN